MKIEPFIDRVRPATAPPITADDYLVIGTLDRADWHANNKQQLTPAQIFDRMWPFRSQLDFTIQTGWYRPDDEKR